MLVGNKSWAFSSVVLSSAPIRVNTYFRANGDKDPVTEQDLSPAVTLSEGVLSQCIRVSPKVVSCKEFSGFRWSPPSCTGLTASIGV